MDFILNVWIIPIIVGIISSLLSAIIIRLIVKDQRLMICVSIIFLLIGIIIAKILYNPLVKVPSIIYKSKDQATLILKKNDLDSYIIEEWNNSVSKYRVLSQDPSPGIMVNKGSTISLIVSKGPRSNSKNLVKRIKKEPSEIIKAEIEKAKREILGLHNEILVLSVDHVSGTIGTYFNFWNQYVDRVLGNKNWSNRQVKLKNLRTGKVAKARLWRSTNGGSLGEGHGRWDDGTASPGQWKAGDIFIIKEKK